MLTRSSMRRWLGGLLSILLGACAGASTQTEVGAEGDMVAPARLGVAEGQVSFWRPGAEKWEPARINTALVAGDAIHTGADGTAEMQIGGRDFARLTANTRIDIVAFDARAARFRVASGLASFDLRSATMDRLITVDTANAAILVNAGGYYRVDTRAGATRLVVRRGGKATLTLADGARLDVVANQELVVPDATRPGVQLHAAPEADAWDRWNDARSDYHAESPSQRLLPPEIYGAADLDRHGAWRSIEPYGSVWVPVVAAGWTPYSAGRWQWDPVYGWTWVDDAPWGWSTSHYGRWVYLDGYWAWVPGPRVARPIYAPALVAFYGVGAGIGWVPLGWDEPLIPWWGGAGFRGSIWWAGWGGPRRMPDGDRIVHRNRHVPHAVVGMPNDRFGREHVRDARLPSLPDQDLRPFRFNGPAKPVSGAISLPRPVPVTPVPPSPAVAPKITLPGREVPKVGIPPPAVPRSDAPRHEMPRPEMPRPEMPRPEMPRPEMPRPVAPHAGSPQLEVPAVGRRGDERFRRDQHSEWPGERRGDDGFRRDDGDAARGSVFRPPGQPNSDAGTPWRPGGRSLPPHRRD